MSTSTSIRRSTRPEALRATSRITEYCKIDMSNSDSDESTTSSEHNVFHPEVFHPEEKHYKHTTGIIRYLIDECNNAEFEDQRRQIVEKIFNYLNKNPNILIYEPKFRNSVINKMKEFENHINEQNNKYNKSKYNKLMSLVRVTLHENVRNSVMRLEIYKHFDAINAILADYESWSKSTPLMKQINELYKTLEMIKKHPFYVANVEHKTDAS
jgi:hypothetical protein